MKTCDFSNEVLYIVVEERHPLKMTRKTKPNEDGEVVKRLFTPEKAATVRKPLHEYGWYWGSKGKHNFGISVCGALVFFALCVSVMLITMKLNATWTDVTMEGL